MGEVRRPPRGDRMDEKAQADRTKMFLLATQGPGKPMIYGTGKPPEKGKS